MSTNKAPGIKHILIKGFVSQQWWLTSLILELGR